LVQWEVVCEIFLKKSHHMPVFRLAEVGITTRKKPGSPRDY